MNGKIASNDFPYKLLVVRFRPWRLASRFGMGKLLLQIGELVRVELRVDLLNAVGADAQAEDDAERVPTPEQQRRTAALSLR